MESPRGPEPSSPEPIAVEFELTPEDWVEVSMDHSWRSKALREARRTIRALVAAIFVVLALLGLLNGSTGMAIAWLLGGGVLFAALDPLLRSSQRNQLRKFAATGIANGMFGRHRVELRPEGMLDATEGYDWLTRWSAIDRVEASEGAFLVYTGPNACLPIPHSAFRDSATLRRFADLLPTAPERRAWGAPGRWGARRRLTSPAPRVILAPMATSTLTTRTTTGRTTGRGRACVA